MTEETALTALAIDKAHPANGRVEAIERFAGLENPGYAVWRILCEIFNDETDNTLVRIAAVRIIARRYPAAAPNQLCRYLFGDPDRRLRREAVAALGLIGRIPDQIEPQLQRDLLAIATEAKPHTLINLAMRDGCDPRTLAALQGSIHSADTEIRATALQGLGMLGEMNEVVSALRDEQPQIRVRAAETLGYYSTLEPSEIAALEKALPDTDETVRRTARTALRRLGVEAAPKAQRKRAATTSSTAPREARFAWEPLLNTWSQEWLSVQEYVVELPDDVIESGWLGFPGASEEQIASAEQRLGATFPSSYREFLRVTNGWRRTSPFIEQVWSAERISPFAVENQEWVDIWHEVGSESPEARFLPSAVQISEVGDAAVYPLMPDLTTADGECEAWVLASWQGTAVRYQSFWELMQAEYESFKRLEHPNGESQGA
jgi:hypothetical protein